MSVIYRPPNSSVPVFATDFLDLTVTSINENGKLLILGDLNIPMNNPDSPDISRCIGQPWPTQPPHIPNTQTAQYP